MPENLCACCRDWLTRFGSASAPAAIGTGGAATSSAPPVVPGAVVITTYQGGLAPFDGLASDFAAGQHLFNSFGSGPYSGGGPSSSGSPRKEADAEEQRRLRRCDREAAFLSVSIIGLCTVSRSASQFACPLRCVSQLAMYHPCTLRHGPHVHVNMRRRTLNRESAKRARSRQRSQLEEAQAQVKLPLARGTSVLSQLSVMSMLY